MVRARHSLVIGLTVALCALGAGYSVAQTTSPPPAAPPAPAPAQPPAPAPAPPAGQPAQNQPAPPPGQPPAEPPANQPAQNQPAPTPGQPPAQPPAQQAQPADPFGEEIEVASKKIIFFKGTATWDSAYETLIDSFKSVNDFIQKEGLKRAGPMMTIYISTDDTGFEYRAAVPIEAVPASPPRGDIEVGDSPSGKMLKFVHRGSYDAMDSTYEAITNFLDTKQLEARETFIEEYASDPLTTSEDQLVINVLVPIK